MQKTKKRTRADLLARINMLTLDTELVRKYVQFAPPNPYITIENIVDKGRQMSEARCSRCGHVYLRNSTWYYGNGRVDARTAQHFACPNCMNKNVVIDPERMLDPVRGCLIVKTEGGFEFVKYSAGYLFGKKDGWQKHQPELSINIRTVGVFDNNLGYVIASKEFSQSLEYKILRKQSSAENSVIFWLKDFTHSNVSAEECKQMLADAHALCEMQKLEVQKRCQKREEKRQEEKRIALEEEKRQELLAQQRHDEEMRADPRWMYKAKDVDIESFVRHPIVAALYNSRTDGSTTYKVACGKCGTIDEVDNLLVYKEYTCPHCGNHAASISTARRWESNEDQIVVLFENTNLPENDLLIRFFSYHCSMDRKNWTPRKTVYEYKRIFAGPKPWVYYKRDPNDPFERYENVIDGVYCGGKDVLVQSEQEIAEIISNSALKYSGLLDSWGLGQCKYTWQTTIPDMQYLRAWYVNPTIEFIMKSNMEHIADYLINNRDRIGKGNTIADVLGIQPELVKVIKEHNMYYREVQDMSQLYQYDNTLTYDTYCQIVNEDLHTSLLCEIAHLYHIRYDKILQYLQSAYDHQCILKKETLSVWSDYLSMASRLGINLADKTKLFPSSLKKEHDIAVFAYRAIQVEIDLQEFAERAKKNKKYEFKYEGLFVHVPETPQEVIEEANAQRNCLRSYVERVKNGETVVAFVRRNEDPDKTFLSAEIRDGRLIQLKGYCNSDPRTKEIVDFTNAWAKARNIIIAC